MAPTARIRKFRVARGKARKSVIKGRSVDPTASVMVYVPEAIGVEGGPDGADGSPLADVRVVAGDDGRETLEVRCGCGRVHSFVLEYGEG
jgi:hypothetical protein